MAFFTSTSNFDFNSSLSPSERIKAAEYFSPTGATAPTLWEKASDLSIPIDLTYGSNAPDLAGILGLDSAQFLGGLAGNQAAGWTFITAPEDVSWDVANQASRVDMFGTNSPPVVAGSRGMRDLSLYNSLVEGFVRNVNVESKVAALEELMNYSLNNSDGFVSVPVYQVWANNKSYGGSNGYFIIRDIKVKESMRDLTGNTTRAYVDLSLMQVPEYQVNSGRDQASQPITAAGATLQQQNQKVTEQAGQKIQGAASKGGTSPTNPNSKPAAGPGVPKSPTPNQRGSSADTRLRLRDEG